MEKSLKSIDVEGIHFLRYDVGIGAYGTNKELHCLKNWGPDFTVAIGGEDVARGLLNAVPQRRFRRQDVSDALDGADLSFGGFGFHA